MKSVMYQNRITIVNLDRPVFGLIRIKMLESKSIAWLVNPVIVNFIEVDLNGRIVHIVLVRRIA
jgi:hypothetical protein